MKINELKNNKIKRSVTVGHFFCSYYSNYIERDESVTRDRWYHGNTKRKKYIGQFSCAKVSLFIM